MEWQLVYIGNQREHLDSNMFDTLKQAMDTAEKCSWARSFEIHGMGQNLKGVYEGNELVWLGI